MSPRFAPRGYFFLAQRVVCDAFLDLDYLPAVYIWVSEFYELVESAKLGVAKFVDLLVYQACMDARGFHSVIILVVVA